MLIASDYSALTLNRPWSQGDSTLVTHEQLIELLEKINAKAMMHFKSEALVQHRRLPHNFQEAVVSSDEWLAKIEAVENKLTALKKHK